MNRRLGRDFFLQLAVFLPVAYYFWYAYGPMFVMPVAHLSNALADLALADVVSKIRQDGVQLAVFTVPRPGVVPILSETGRELLKGWGFNVYTPPLGAGIPLFMALALASTVGLMRHMLNIALGLGVLFIGQSLSVLLKVAATLLPELSAAHGPDGPCSVECLRQLVTMAHYFTYMVLPPLLPVVAWGLLYLPFVRRLVTDVGDGPDPA